MILHCKTAIQAEIWCNTMLKILLRNTAEFAPCFDLEYGCDPNCLI